jgi:hypothetical protein
MPNSLLGLCTDSEIKDFAPSVTSISISYGINLMVICTSICEVGENTYTTTGTGTLDFSLSRMSYADYLAAGLIIPDNKFVLFYYAGCCDSSICPNLFYGTIVPPLVYLPVVADCSSTCSPPIDGCPGGPWPGTDNRSMSLDFAFNFRLDPDDASKCQISVHYLSGTGFPEAFSSSGSSPWSEFSNDMGSYDFFDHHTESAISCSTNFWDTTVSIKFM